MKHYESIDIKILELLQWNIVDEGLSATELVKQISSASSKYNADLVIRHIIALADEDLVWTDCEEYKDFYQEDKNINVQIKSAGLVCLRKIRSEIRRDSILRK